MNHHPTVNRETFHKLLASAFVVQQSQMDSQSRAAIVELRRLITSGELDVDGAIHVRKIPNTTGAAGDTLAGAQLPLLGLERDRSTGAYLSPLASMLAAHDTGDLLTETALDPALSGTVPIAEIIRLIDLSCAVERSTSPPSDEPPDATDSSDACIAALRLRAPEVKIAPLQSRDPWTPLLVIVAIALAFLLGWMLVQVTVLGATRPVGPPLPVTTGLGAPPRSPRLTAQIRPAPLRFCRKAVAYALIDLRDLTLLNARLIEREHRTTHHISAN